MLRRHPCSATIIAPPDERQHLGLCPEPTPCCPVFLTVPHDFVTEEEPMADGGSGATGILGVLVGAILVIFVGAAVLMSTGQLGKAGGGGKHFTIKLPDAK
jgi:hypothetical protein